VRGTFSEATGKLMSRMLLHASGFVLLLLEFALLNDTTLIYSGLHASSDTSEGGRNNLPAESLQADVIFLDQALAPAIATLQTVTHSWLVAPLCPFISW
jgi:hypothetical protein